MFALHTHGAALSNNFFTGQHPEEQSDRRPGARGQVSSDETIRP